MTFSDPMDLFRAAIAGAAAEAGYYNRNVVVDTPTGPLIVRIPIGGADEMDLRVWPEHEVLRAVEPYVDGAPKVLHVSQEPAFSLHEYVAGDLVDRVAPRSVALPGFVVRDVIDLFGQLVRVPQDCLPSTPEGWPAEGDTPGFGQLLTAVSEQAYTRYRDDFVPLFAELGVPADPFDSVRAAWSSLTARPFRLVHADIHRKNMIAADERTVFLDWELALWGDPLYDLAVHLHKMGYRPDERAVVVRGWLRAVPEICARGWEDDLGVYLRHEQVKSAIVDTVRYAKQVAADPGAAHAHLLGKLADKLNAASQVWVRRSDLDRPAVERAVRGWARG